MGCITSTQPKRLNNNGIKSQTELMLKRSVTFNDQLRIIIDDDRYKQIQNTIKKTKYVELSQSNSNSQCGEISTSTNSREISVSSSISVNIFKNPNGGVTLMGLAKNEDMNMDNDSEESLTKTDSEPSLLQTGSVTLMGIADSNEIFIHTNHDLNNKIICANNNNPMQKEVKYDIQVTPGCCSTK